MLMILWILGMNLCVLSLVLINVCMGVGSVVGCVIYVSLWLLVFIRFKFLLMVEMGNVCMGIMFLCMVLLVRVIISLLKLLWFREKLGVCIVVILNSGLLCVSWCGGVYVFVVVGQIGVGVDIVGLCLIEFVVSFFVCE